MLFDNVCTESAKGAAMITIGPLTLRPTRVIDSMYAEMADALEAMEIGDYDRAYGILEAVTRPAETLSADDVPENLKDDLVAVRIFRQIVESGPPGFYWPMHSLSIGVLSELLAKATRDPSLLDCRDELALVLMYAHSCGLSFDIEISD